MKRRAVLAASVTAAVGLAGCGSRGGNPEESGNGDTGGTDTPEPTATTTTPEPEMGEASITVRSQACGDAENSASVEFGSGEVVVAGSMGVSNPCHTPTMEDISFESGTLSMTVGATQNDGVCASCLATLEYRATVAFEGGLPGTVQVSHNAMESVSVTEATRDA